MNSEEKYVLYADDDHEDRETLIEMMQELPGELNVVCVDNGLAAIEFLDTLKPGEVFPCFVILDINMPVMNGLETLSFLKNHPVYNSLSVIIYTTSQDINDRIMAQALKANDFIIKPFQFSELAKLAQKFADMCGVVPVRRK
jgi:CheY-like chemotaxis protein